MTAIRPAFVAVLLGAVLTACVPLAQPPGTTGSATPSGTIMPDAGSTVAVREHPSRRFVALIGPKAQHAPLFLGTPGTNFYCLRSFVDRKTGDTANQLYVSESYDGAERKWNAAHGAAGQTLVFIPISRNEIACDAAGCSYAEEFAADIPPAALRGGPQSFAVDFTDPAGDKKTITVSAEQIAEQIAAVDAQLKAMASAAASTEPAAPNASAHQP